MLEAYRRKATGNVMHVGMNYLSELVIRPGIRKYLEPLCLYRGAMTPGQAHRLWNFALLMMAAEAETLSDGLKLAHNPAFAQLCGPVRIPPKITLNMYFGRLWDNPDVTNEISGLTDYVRSLELGPSHLIRVPEVSHDRYCAPWRTSDHPLWEPGAERPESGTRALYYPYLVHDPEKDDGRALVVYVNSLVPKYLPDQVRADACQDLIEALLTGKADVSNAPEFVDKFVRDVYKMHPQIWDGHGGYAISADAPRRHHNNDERPSIKDSI